MNEVQVISTARGADDELRLAAPRLCPPPPLLAAPYFAASREFEAKRRGSSTTVTVGVLLTGVVYYFWYLDGVFLGRSSSPTKTLVILAADQGRLEVLQTNDPRFDAAAHAPAGYPARRTLRFIRSVDSSIDRYRVEQQKDGGAWVVLGFVQDDPKRWAYQFRTPRLEDLATYAWRVVPVDRAGNAGAAVSLGSDLIVRVPDGPDFSATFNAATSRVTFAEAS